MEETISGLNSVYLLVAYRCSKYADWYATRGQNQQARWFLGLSRSMRRMLAHVARRLTARTRYQGREGTNHREEHPPALYLLRSQMQPTVRMWRTPTSIDDSSKTPLQLVVRKPSDGDESMVKK
jgi:hypothetical protein